MAKEVKPKAKTTKKVTPKKVVTKTQSKKVVKKQAPKTTKKVVVEQQTNNYSKTVISAIIIIALVIGAYFIYQLKDGKLLPKEDPKYVQTESEKKFENEYESLNGEIREKNNTEHKKVDIISDNNVEEITLEQAVKIIDEGYGVIYFGYAADPLSRNAIETLLKAMDNTSIDKLYYVNVRKNDQDSEDIRDIYSLDDKNKIKMTKEASKDYYILVSQLDDYLDYYTLTNNNGKVVKTSVKRLTTPVLVAVKEGQIVGAHVGTVEGHVLDNDEKVADLTEVQKNDLYNIYEKIFESYKSDTCDVEKGC